MALGGSPLERCQRAAKDSSSAAASSQGGSKGIHQFEAHTALGATVGGPMEMAERLEGRSSELWLWSVMVTLGSSAFGTKSLLLRYISDGRGGRW